MNTSEEIGRCALDLFRGTCRGLHSTKAGEFAIAAVLMDIRDELHGIRELMEERKAEEGKSQ